MHLIQHWGWSGSNARSFTSTTLTQLASSLTEFERKNTAPNPNPNKTTSSLLSNLYLSILWIYLIEGSRPSEESSSRPKFYLWFFRPHHWQSQRLNLQPHREKASFSTPGLWTSHEIQSLKGAAVKDLGTPGRPCSYAYLHS